MAKMVYAHSDYHETIEETKYRYTHKDWLLVKFILGLSSGFNKFRTNLHAVGWLPIGTCY